MCRPIAAGGRRCPAHTDPVKIAERNARRRETYRATKQTFYFTHHNDALGITVEGHSKPVAGFTGTTITGEPNYWNFDENSYQQFGFAPVTPGVFNRTNTTDPAFKRDFHKISQQELDELTDEERAAIKFYSSANHRWVNKALYGDGSLLTYHSTKEFELTLDNVNTIDHTDTLEEEYITPELAQDVIDLLDEALQNGSHKQRILYRGLSKFRTIFQNKENVEEAVNEWVDEHYQLGQETTFEAFLSTTTNPEKAVNYSGGAGGIVFEILTPEGVAVSADSFYKDEEEVLLPRNHKFITVGVHKNLQLPEGGTTTLIQLVGVNDDGEILDGTNNTPPEPFTIPDEGY